MSWKPAYLVHGDDHGRIAERRASLRRRAEEESGAQGVELFEGETSTPEVVAGALAAMTFAMGHRFLVVEGAERFKDAEVAAVLAPALKAIGPDTTVAFFAREDGRAKAPKALVDAVKKAGGDVVAESALKAKALPGWATGEAQRLGISLDSDAAHALVDLVGERQQRLLRELEKLALEHGPGARLTREDIEDAAASSSERAAWGLGDALVARDRRAAIRIFLELRAQGEAIARLIPLLARRLRDVEQVAARLDAGEAPAAIKASTKGIPWMVDRRIREARDADVDHLRSAIRTLAALERSSRGMDEVSEDTAAIRAIGRIAAAA